MAQKKLQKDSAYQHLDTNNDDTLCDDEISMALEFKRRELEDADARRDSMRYMTWFALFGTLNYPAAILITSMLGYENAATMITDIAPTYFVANSALVAAYFGANAYASQITKRYGNYGSLSGVPAKHRATAYCKPVKVAANKELY